MLIDELPGRQEAVRMGLQIIGTLGVLLEAHKRSLLDLHVAIDRLRLTTFKASDSLLQKFIDLA